MANRRRDQDSSLPMKSVYTARGSTFRVADVAREEGWNTPIEQSADWVLMHDLRVLRAISNLLYDSSADYAGMIETGLDNVLGPRGFGLQARTAKPDLNAELERVWRRWCDRCDVTGRLTWSEQQRMALRAQWVDGDALMVKTLGCKLQQIESQQFNEWQRYDNVAGGNQVVLGVETTPQGAPVAYHIREYANGMPTATTSRRLEASACLHLAAFRRPSQHRGVPLATQGLSEANRTRDVKDSNAAAWVMLSRIVATWTRKNPAEVLDELADTKTASETEPGDFSNRIFNVNDKTIFVGAEGEEIRAMEQNRPGPDFEKSLNAFQRGIALAMGMPREVAMMDFGSMNYSSAKAAQNQARQNFDRWQDATELHLYRPVYHWVILEWVMETGRLDLLNEPTLLAHDWVKPSPPWLDPQKEVQALGDEMDLGLKTHADVLKSRGQDRTEWLTRRANEIIEAVKEENRIVEETGSKDVRGVWRTLAGLSMSDGAQTAVVQATLGAPSESAAAGVGGAA